MVYDAIIIGSGLGGLASAVILAKEGMRVLVLEKNNQFGGNLQTFSRQKTLFDTGVHYLGGLAKGQNLYTYFKYLGICDHLDLHPLDQDGYDLISFDGDSNTYPHAQGYENFVQKLLPYFPEEAAALHAYTAKIREVCGHFPLYNVAAEGVYPADAMGVNAKDFLDSITKNEKLKAVLAGSTYLYAGIGEKTPLFVHALSVNSYMQSAWRVGKGGSQITRALLAELKRLGGSALKRHHVAEIMYENNQAVGVRTLEGEEFRGHRIISNIDIKATLAMCSGFRKAFVNRVQMRETGVASFSVYAVLRPGTLAYQNHNRYHFSHFDAVWNGPAYSQNRWPESYMVSMTARSPDDSFAQSLAIMTYMRFEEVQEWEATFNTAAHKGDRGPAYEQFKQKRINRVLEVVEQQYPGLRDSIAAVDASTPLTYRDYIGIDRGSMYGYIKDSARPLLHFISPIAPVKGLYFTGQSVNMHGILGVTIGAVATCAEILGKEYLLEKINREKVLTL